MEHGQVYDFHRMLVKRSKSLCKHCFNDTIVNGTVVHTDYSGEIATLIRVGMLMLGLMVLCCIIVYCNKREAAIEAAKRLKRMAARKKRGTRSSMLGDQDDGDAGVEMSEMNEAAEEAAELGEGNGEVILTREGMDGVRDELTKMRLEQYASEFESGGYDDWKEVLRLPPHRLEKMVEFVGMSTNHGDRFKEQLREQRRRYGMHQVMPKGANEAADEGCVIM